MLREATKPKLSDEIASVVLKAALASFEEDGSVTHVLDGGSLLQKIPWEKDTTFENIATLYVKHVSKHFQNAVVVLTVTHHAPIRKT